MTQARAGDQRLELLGEIILRSEGLLEPLLAEQLGADMFADCNAVVLGVWRTKQRSR